MKLYIMFWTCSFYTKQSGNLCTMTLSSKYCCLSSSGWRKRPWSGCNIITLISCKYWRDTYLGTCSWGRVNPLIDSVGEFSVLCILGIFKWSTHVPSGDLHVKHICACSYYPSTATLMAQIIRLPLASSVTYIYCDSICGMSNMGSNWNIWHHGDNALRSYWIGSQVGLVSFRDLGTCILAALYHVSLL